MCPRPPTPTTTTVLFGVEVRQRPLYRVIGRQRGIAQRSGLRRTQVTERNQQSRGGHEHVFGHPTVETQSAAEAVHWAQFSQ